jgi:hypothetical protein
MNNNAIFCYKQQGNNKFFILKTIKMEIKSYEKNWKNVINIVLYLDHVENLGFSKSLISLYMGVFKL